MENKIAFIINPISGSGKGKDMIKKVRHFSLQNNIDSDIFVTKNSDDAILFTQKLITQKPKLIVACGGDGTINQIAQCLVNKNIPLGIIPLGSGNGLASNLKIPQNIDQALELLLQPNPQKIDVGRLNDNFFFSNVGFGVDALVIKRYTEKKKRTLLGYVRATIWALSNYQPLSYKISYHHKEILINNVFFLLCSNTNQAGYGFSFTPNAKINDGFLDLVYIDNINWIKLLTLSYYFLTKQIHRSKFVHISQLQSFTIYSEKNSVIAQIDGESFIIDDQKITIEILPKALLVVAPK